MRIAHLSDLHIDSKADVIYGVSPKENLSRAVSLLKKIPDIDVGIVTGDITNDGEYESLVKADELLSPLGFPIYVLAGNHDNVEIVKRLADPIRKMQAKGSFNIGSCHFLMLNSVWKDETKGNKSRGLLSFDELDRIRSFAGCHEPVILAMHHPVIETGSWLDKRLLSNREQLLGIIKNYPNIKLVLCGHNHYPEQIQIGQCLFCTAPSVSTSYSPYRKPFEEGYTPGFNIIDFYSDLISVKTHYLY